MRVTVEEVKEIFSTDMEYNQVLAFIRTASVVVTNVVEVKGVLSTDELKQLELWLAAHFACIRDPISLRSKIGDADAWFFPVSVTTAWGSGLKLTPYGQQAMVIDHTGALADLGKSRASFRAARREDSDFYTEGLTKS